MNESKGFDPMRDLSRWFEGSSEMRARARLQVDAISEAQLGALHEWQGIVHSWFDHQRLRAAATGEAMRDMCESRDPVGALSAYQRWLVGETNEIARELAKSQAQGARVIQAWSAAMRPVDVWPVKASETGERVRGATKNRAGDPRKAA